MCGIAGIILPSQAPVNPEWIERMMRCQHHRGPDEQSAYHEPGVGFGFCRLAIIDLKGGHQPMRSQDGTQVIVFNGEIYNFQILRAQLEATGRYQFKTQSDTEVLLNAYAEYGESCVDHFRGMFAFAIWDSKHQRLFAARDRFGKKPFFYFTPKSGGIVFASELQALYEHPECPRNIDWKAMNAYLRFQYIPAPHTIYQDIQKLPAAHRLSWSAQNGVQVERYWDLPYEPKVSYRYEEAKERLRWHLMESVRLRMIADVPLGAFLSGGIDSSILVALMAKQSSRPIQTFSIGFEESEFSELPYAKQVAARYHTAHHEFVVKPELVQDLPQIAKQYSEPFADPSALPTYYLSQLTRQHVTVALTGDGGDETFAGYLRYKAMAGLHVWNHLPPFVRHGANQLGRRLLSIDRALGWQNRLRRFFDLGAQAKSSQYFHAMEFFHPAELVDLWNPQVKETFLSGSMNNISGFDHGDALPKHWLDQLLYLDLHHYLPDCLMTKVDIATMAHSLEGRSPFLDHVLVEETARWPAEWKLSAGLVGKKILKDTFKPDLPAELLHRTKQGFGIPVAEWFRGPLRSYLEETLLSSHAMNRSYFQPNTIRRYVDEHQRGLQDHGSKLWALLMLELWHQQQPRVTP